MNFLTATKTILRDGFSSFHIPLNPRYIDQIFLYCDELERWNKHTNLIGKADRRTILVRHILDSLTVYPLLSGKKWTILDIGAGAGFPSIPLAIVLPQCKITASERRKKRASFLRNVVHLLQLNNVVVEEKDTRDIPGSFNCIIARGVGTLSHICSLSKHHRKEKAMIIAFKGKISEIKREVTRLKEAVGTSDDIDVKVKKVRVPYMEEEERHIVIIETK